MSDQDPRASLKCRLCSKRYVNMYSPFLGFCPSCGAKHTIQVTTKEELYELHMKCVEKAREIATKWTKNLCDTHYHLKGEPCNERCVIEGAEKHMEIGVGARKR